MDFRNIIVDRVARLCLNWPMGLFEFADSLGIDAVVSTLEALTKELGPSYLPARLSREMVAASKLGRKASRGFYNYPRKV